MSADDRLRSPTLIAEDGTVRKVHYGDGRQPWDDIVELGWAPEFAAANILKYLRRTKDPEHSLASARWYLAALRNLVADRDRAAIVAYAQIAQVLTLEEITRLEGKDAG
jgi:hypothetical protein